MRKVIFFLFISLLGFSSRLAGQEILLDLQSIPIKGIKSKKVNAQHNSRSVLSLPFFDDFSNGLSYPDQRYWSDAFVIINQNYAINPPNIGVATFDAINQYGKLYSRLSTSSLPADTLTSQPININLPESDSIYFSFQYQPQGLGKEPQVNDSLVVEFFSKTDNLWIRVWAASAHFTNNSIIETFRFPKKTITKSATKISNKFFKVLLPITDERFRNEEFRLRFINYASLPLNTDVPSVRGNCDQWNIDLVYLNNNRNYVDTLLDDVAFSKPIKSFLKNYESIPWKHFNSQAIQAELTDPLSFNMQYTNLSPNTWNVTRRFTITDLSNQANPYLFSGGADNILPYQTIDYTRNYEYSFASNWEDSAKYCMESYLITDSNNDYLRTNDTVKYTQKFLNYYAYDDGSAENGYGIFGEGSQNGMVALKYHSYLSDSLKGVLFYFNQIYDYSKTNFLLTIWNDNNGKPGDTLYQKDVYKPVLSYNKDTLYRISKPLKIGGSFWVGWVNKTTDMLNVGFDLNNNHNDKLYYNLSGNWVQSAFSGSLMIKPVFGNFAKGQTGIDKPTKNYDFTIFPNPAINHINLNLAEGEFPASIRIINLAGQVVISRLFENSSIDISNIPSGIYLLQLTFRDKTTAAKKLVIIK